MIPERYGINSKSNDTYKLFLANISDEATDEDLYNLFCKYYILLWYQKQ